MKSLAVFASGKGSNAKNIIQYFKNNKDLKIGLIVSSHKEAGVLSIAQNEKIPIYILDKKEYYGTGDQLLQICLLYTSNILIWGNTNRPLLLLKMY